jgi:hypothetical protein
MLQQYMLLRAPDPVIRWSAHQLPAGGSSSQRPQCVCTQRCTSPALIPAPGAQIYDESSSGVPRLKASQCFTKYKWRPLEAAAAAGGPAIVATQVVSDYLTPYDGEQLYIQAMNKPVATYLYRMAFRQAAGPVAAEAGQQ